MPYVPPWVLIWITRACIFCPPFIWAIKKLKAWWDSSAQYPR